MQYRTHHCLDTASPSRLATLLSRLLGIWQGQKSSGGIWRIQWNILKNEITLKWAREAVWRERVPSSHPAAKGVHSLGMTDFCEVITHGKINRTHWRGLRPQAKSHRGMQPLPFQTLSQSRPGNESEGSSISAALPC